MRAQRDRWQASRGLAALGLLALALALAATSALAAEGRTPIHESTTIDRPGSYFVTQDIIGEGVVITIAASEVELDLNGFRLRSTGENPSPRGAIRVESQESVRVHNGVIVSESDGLVAHDVRGLVVEGLRVAFPGTVPNRIALDLRASQSVRVTDVHVSGDFIHGVYFLDPEGVGSLVARELRFFGRPTGNAVYVNGALSALVEDVGFVSGPDVTEEVVYAENAFGTRISRVRGIGRAGDGVFAARIDGSVLERVLLADSDAGVEIFDSEAFVVSDSAVAASRVGIGVSTSSRGLFCSNLTNANDLGLTFTSTSLEHLFRLNVSRGNAISDFDYNGPPNDGAGDNFLPGPY